MALTRRAFGGLVLGAPLTRAAQNTPRPEFSPDYETLATEPPRLFLRPQRLRLLRRETERGAARWQQFRTLAGGGARMPEEAFALALYYRAGGDEAAGRRAVEAALAPAADLRQSALVFDWCQDLLDPKQSAALGAKLRQEIQRPPRGDGCAEARTRVLAAVALAGSDAKLAGRELRRVVEQWWERRIAPALRAGRAVLGRRDLYPLTELLHAVRDNLIVDLRDAAPAFFKDWPLYDLISYYPASYPAAENEYRIPAVKGAEPDLDLAAASRAAELAMVAYDNNAVEHQFLQGWLMHDRFLMRAAHTIPYEFLWANPYQPGLSYYVLPTVFHDQRFGRLFIRSTWDDTAFWLGYFDGQLQVFSDGEPKILKPADAREPVRLGEAAVATCTPPARIELKDDTKTLYLVGLAASRSYDVEIDDREMSEERSDRGGILALNFPGGFRGGVRLKEAPGRAMSSSLRDAR